MNLIEVRNLEKRYGDRSAVDHLSFSMEKGRIYGFLGPNGAGKSTTMNIMTGYLGPTAGDVIVDGYSILEEPEKAKRSIGYLPEQPPLYMDMTVSEYLSFAAELKKIPKSGRVDAIAKSVSFTGLQDVRGRMIRNLSKGYRQRVGLAQAILGFPEIIILDEPTVGLDPKQIMEFRDLIRELGKEHTVILSSHILSEVQEVCDHVLIIHHGKLLASGTPLELEHQIRGTTLELTVKSDNAGAVSDMLSAINGIARITESRNNQPGQVSVKLETEPDADPREQIFYACADRRYPILTLCGLDLSLEQVFLSLTEEVETGTDEKQLVPEQQEEREAAEQ